MLVIPCTFCSLVVVLLMRQVSGDWPLGDHYMLGENVTSIGADLVPGVDGEYPCLGSLQIDRWNERRLLVGVCTTRAAQVSGGIGYMTPYDDTGLAQPLTVFWGNVLNSRDTASADGNGTDAQIRSPENFYQTDDYRILFTDLRSCGRQINLTNNQVTTVHPSCTPDGTLDIPEIQQGVIIGMTYNEDGDMWVYAVANWGVYLFAGDGSNSRLLIVKKDTSGAKLRVDNAQMLKHDPNDRQMIWHKVSYGLNRYNMTGVTVTDGDFGTEYGNLKRFNSYVSESDTPDDTARYQSNNSTAATLWGELGHGELLWPAGGYDFITVIDQERDVPFIMDTRDGSYQVFCKKSDTVVDGGSDACTFKDIRSAFWRDNSTLIVYEYEGSVFRKLTLIGNPDRDASSTFNTTAHPSPTPSTTAMLTTPTAHAAITTFTNQFTQTTHTAKTALTKQATNTTPTNQVTQTTPIKQANHTTESLSTNQATAHPYSTLATTSTATPSTQTTKTTSTNQATHTTQYTPTKQVTKNIPTKQAIQTTKNIPTDQATQTPKNIPTSQATHTTNSEVTQVWATSRFGILHAKNTQYKHSKEETTQDSFEATVDHADAAKLLQIIATDPVQIVSPHPAAAAVAMDVRVVPVAPTTTTSESPTTTTVSSKTSYASFPDSTHAIMTATSSSTTFQTTNSTTHYTNSTSTTANPSATLPTITTTATPTNHTTKITPTNHPTQTTPNIPTYCSARNIPTIPVTSTTTTKQATQNNPTHQTTQNITSTRGIQTTQNIPSNQTTKNILTSKITRTSPITKTTNSEVTQVWATSHFDFLHAKNTQYKHSTEETTPHKETEDHVDIAKLFQIIATAYIPIASSHSATAAMAMAVRGPVAPTSSTSESPTTTTVVSSKTSSASFPDSTHTIMTSTTSSSTTFQATSGKDVTTVATQPTLNRRDFSVQEEGTWWTVLAIVCGACTPVFVFWVAIKVIECRRYGVRFDLFSDDDDLDKIDPITAKKINFLYNKAVVGQEYQEKPPNKEASKALKKRYRPKSTDGGTADSPRGKSPRRKSPRGKKKALVDCSADGSRQSASASIIDKFRLPQLRKKKKRPTDDDLEELQPVKRKSASKNKPRPPSMTMEFGGNTVAVPLKKTELGRARPLPAIPQTL